jgi:hypothetical protein
MKKILLSFALVMFLSFVGFSQTSYTREQILEEMAKAGEMHNQALDYVFSKIQANPSILNNVNNSASDKMSFIEQIILNNRERSNPLNLYLNDQNKAPILSSNVKKIDSIILNALQSEPRNSFADIVEKTIQLSSDEVAFYGQLSAIISNNESNMQNLEIELNSFNDSVFNFYGLNSKSTLTLIGASAFAKSSANYWYTNTTKWVSLSSNGGGLNSRKTCRTVKADVVGGVSGAIGGGISGAIVGGIGAVPGAIVGGLGGALAGSVGEAVGCLIDWLWP